MVIELEHKSRVAPHSGHNTWREKPNIARIGMEKLNIKATKIKDFYVKTKQYSDLNTKKKRRLEGWSYKK